MGNELSRVVDTLYPLPPAERLAGFNKLLGDDVKLSESLLEGAAKTKLGPPTESTAAASTKSRREDLDSSTKCGKGPGSSNKSWEDPASSKIVTRQHIKTWSKDPSRLFKDHGGDASGFGVRTAFYDETVDLIAEHYLTAVALRFRKLFYYDVLCCLNPQGTQKFRGDSYNKLADLIVQGSNVPRKLKEIVSNLKTWAVAGRRYNKLSETYGTAILFVIPEEIFTLDYLEKKLALGEKWADERQQFEPLKKRLRFLDGVEQAEDDAEDDAEEGPAQHTASRIREFFLTQFTFFTENLSASEITAKPKRTSGSVKQVDRPSKRRRSSQEKPPSAPAVADEQQTRRSENAAFSPDTLAEEDTSVANTDKRQEQVAEETEDQVHMIEEGNDSRARSNKSIPKATAEQVPEPDQPASWAANPACQDETSADSEVERPTASGDYLQLDHLPAAPTTNTSSRRSPCERTIPHIIHNSATSPAGVHQQPREPPVQCRSATPASPVARQVAVGNGEESTTPEVMPITDLHSYYSGTIANVAVSCQAPSSDALYSYVRCDVFVGHGTPDRRETLTRRDLTAGLPFPTSPDCGHTTYMEGLSYFDTADIEFQSF